MSAEDVAQSSQPTRRMWIGIIIVAVVFTQVLGRGRDRCRCTNLADYDDRSALPNIFLLFVYCAIALRIFFADTSVRKASRKCGEGSRDPLGFGVGFRHHTMRFDKRKVRWYSMVLRYIRNLNPRRSYCIIGGWNRTIHPP